MPVQRVAGLAVPLDPEGDKVGKIIFCGYAATDTEQRETRYCAHDSNEPPQCHRCTRSCAQR
jgi:hypothetical protein